MDDFAALRLQLEWGADEALDEQPVDRMVARAAAVAASSPLPAAPRPAEAARIAPVSVPVSVPVSIPLAASPKPAQIRAQDVANAARSRDELREAMRNFDGCALAATATRMVFADGNPESGLMLVGEAPGAEEDRIGKPFVGASGLFLDRMLASIGLDRDKFLITNLVPWRPPGNRNPTDSEVLLCLPFLLRHIALVRPRRLVLLGGLAAQSVLGSKTGITRLRGNWTKVTIPGLEQPIPTLPMLHPAYLLRNAGAKREAWRDLVALRRHLDSEVE
jgi:uracil-DNA glycosylase family 4